MSKQQKKHVRQPTFWSSIVLSYDVFSIFGSNFSWQITMESSVTHINSVLSKQQVDDSSKWPTSTRNLLNRKFTILIVTISGSLVSWLELPLCRQARNLLQSSKKNDFFNHTRHRNGCSYSEKCDEQNHSGKDIRGQWWYIINWTEWIM